jgi:glycerol-3-phosphate dehydrogenase
MADFASGTSANSLKVIHGGLRYLQHGDIRRMRTSIRERRTWMRIAPHLVHPLPVLIPTYGSGVHSKAAFALALMLNDAVSYDRNRGLDVEHRLPRGRVLSQSACLHLAPGLQRAPLTGGAFFYDAQVHNSERLLLACLQAAAAAGAVLANYTKVVGLLTHRDCIIGAHVQDVLQREEFDIRARMLINTTGPWSNQLLQLLPRPLRCPPLSHAKAINLITRSLEFPCAVGVQSWQDVHDPDALINTGSRFLFITPWRGRSLIGTAYTLPPAETSRVQVTPDDIRQFLAEINRAYPPAQLHYHDVSFVHSGSVPIVDTPPITGTIQLAKHHHICDHRQDGWQGLLSVVGVKYTTARYVAERVVAQVFQVWGQRPGPSRSASTPLPGGATERFADFLQAEIRRRPCDLGEDTVRHLVSTYGTAYAAVLPYVPVHRAEEAWEAVRTAEVLYGIEHEMAQKFTDIVFRRTDLGTAGHPGRGLLWHCAKVMGAQLGWEQTRIQQEFDEVTAQFSVYTEQYHDVNSRVGSTVVH